MLAFSTVPTPIGRLLQPWVCKGGAVPFDTKHADAFSVFEKERSQTRGTPDRYGALLRHENQALLQYVSIYSYLFLRDFSVTPCIVEPKMDA